MYEQQHRPATDEPGQTYDSAFWNASYIPTSLAPAHAAPPRRRRWWIAGAIAAVLAIGGITTGVALASSGGEESDKVVFDQDVAAEQAETHLEEATDLCFPLRGPDINLGDEGRSLSIVGAGHFAGPSIDDVSCLLTELDTPDSVMARMNSTRALDGMQEAEWDGFTAVWTYHPDDGMNIIIEEQ